MARRLHFSVIELRLGPVAHYVSPQQFSTLQARRVTAALVGTEDTVLYVYEKHLQPKAARVAATKAYDAWLAEGRPNISQIRAKVMSERA